MSAEILVVDDDADLRETLQLLLEEGGYAVKAAANGRTALDMLNAGARPSVILLDLMMPEMNGWEFIERARADSVLGAIPIVVMTARKAVDGLPLPSRQVLHKPFDTGELIDAIERYGGARA